jgi:uncharacterized SAM-binding protein YcdF (DUF218 family)
VEQGAVYVDTMKKIFSILGLFGILLVMFTLAKVLQSLILPPGSFLILMAFGFLIIRSCRMLGRLFIASGFILLYAASIGPVTDALIMPLEKSHPPLQEKARFRADAVVVLGGGARDLSWLGLGPQASETSIERVVRGVTLSRRHRLPLVLVGGSGDPAKARISEAEAMARIAAELGVPGRDITVEGDARNTLESAGAVKSALTGKRILLVTSAYHMRRAAGMFKRQGFEVVPAPCGYRGEERKSSFLSFIPHADNLSYSSNALAEYISIAWYTIVGEL